MIDGRNAERRLRQILNESSLSDYIDKATSYDFIYDAVIEFVKRAWGITGSDTITTVSGQHSYPLDSSFLSFYMVDDENRYFVIWDNGAAKTEIFIRDYGAIIYEQNVYSSVTTTAIQPDNFAIIDTTPSSNITGTATSTHAISNDEAVLDDTTLAHFSTVCVGDRITNIDDNSDGYVAQVVSSSEIIVALLGGTHNYFTIGDHYAIMPQQRLSIYFDPAPLTSGYTVAVPYLKKPPPVYSSFRSYPLQNHLLLPIVEYAAFLYKYRDRATNMGDVWYKHFEEACRSSKALVDRTLNRSGYRANFMKRLSKRYSSHR